MSYLEDKGYSTVSRSAGALVESLQSFMELKWFDHEFCTICTDFLHNVTETISDNNSKTKTRCFEEFNIGKLEENLRYCK